MKTARKPRLTTREKLAVVREAIRLIRNPRHWITGSWKRAIDTKKDRRNARLLVREMPCRPDARVELLPSSADARAGCGPEAAGVPKRRLDRGADVNIPLPDANVIPKIGTPEREAHEREALGRGYELIHEEEGRLRNTLHSLECELEGRLWERTYPQTVRDYARTLVAHVEQCWATDIIAARERRVSS